MASPIDPIPTDADTQGPTGGNGNGSGRGASDPAGERPLTRDAMLQVYQQMLRIRRFEEKAGQLFGLGEIRGSCHLYIGQEAIAAGLARVRQPQDRTLCAYRGHGHYLACGGDLLALMSELCGRACGLTSGKGGSVNIFWPEGGFYGGHGIVGANAPLAAGLALAGTVLKEDRVTWCILGDRAIDQGQVAETFRLAQARSLPIVFVVEDNAGDTPETADLASSGASEVAGGEDGLSVGLQGRGLGCGIPGESADGMDVEAVVAAAGRIGDAVRSRSRPRLLVLSTDRYRGHSLSRPGKYATAEGDDRHQRAQRPDPLVRARDRLLLQGVEESELREVDRVVREEINAAAAFALSDSEPSQDQLITDISGKGRSRMTAYRRVHGEPSEPDTLRGAKTR